MRCLLGDREREVSEGVKDRARSPRLGLLRPVPLPPRRRSGVIDRLRGRRYLGGAASLSTRLRRRGGVRERDRERDLDRRIDGDLLIVLPSEVLPLCAPGI